MVIRPGDRVADVIARDPDLIDAFVAAAPTFSRLRNPALRRVMGRLVTVEQAARIAGIEVSALLDRLNGTLGTEGVRMENMLPVHDAGAGAAGLAPAPTEPMPAELAGADPGRVVDLDVREDLRSGVEPFSRIMAARRSLPEDGILRLRAIFEPVPLYAVFGKQGFLHWTERLGAEDWRVWFYPGLSREVEASGEAEAGCGEPGGGKGPDRVVVLDVRGLEPPEPMLRTLHALESLPQDHTLVQINVKEPRFLLPQLEERGFQYEVREQEPGLVRVFIQHAAGGTMDVSAGERRADRVLDVRVIPPREKHPAIFETFKALEVGESFVLVNDHDPKPLRYQFEFEHAGEFTWDYLEEGPVVWRVRIGRVA
jgi:uncharacterized protein (DUF2249 family)